MAGLPAGVATAIELPKVAGTRRKVPTRAELDEQVAALWASLDPFLAQVLRAAGFADLDTVAQIHTDDGAPGTAVVTIGELEDAISNEVSGGDPAALASMGYNSQPRYRILSDGTRAFDFRFLPGQKVLLKRFVYEARNLVSTRTIVDASETRRKSARRYGPPSADLGPDGEDTRPSAGVDPSKRQDFEQAVDRLIRKFAIKMSPSSPASSWTLGRDYMGDWEDGRLRILCKCRARLRIQTQGRTHQPNTGNFTRHLMTSCQASGLTQLAVSPTAPF